MRYGRHVTVKMADENEAMLLLLLLYRSRRRKKSVCRKTWVKRWLARRSGQGTYMNLIQELRLEDPERFRQYHRLDEQCFEEVLSMVGPLISKQDTRMRLAVSPSERLAVTLRFLATGESFRSLSFQFRLGERTISAIIEETSEALYTTMKDRFLKTPSSADEWLEVVKQFEQKWQYPCCLGALDGKHIAIQQPSHSGSEFFNYKHYFSVLLLALVDANYKFMYVDVGASGRAGDAGVFGESALKKALEANTLDIPPAARIEGIPEGTIHHHFVADDAFPLSNRMMKPFPHRHMDNEQKVFNYRLSRARRTVENAFGIFSNRFRVFLTTIKLNPDKVTFLILAACCLHNYLVEKNKHCYTSVGDVENVDHTFTPGSWRRDPQLLGESPSLNRNPAKSAKEQRQHLMAYFSRVGAVPWQEEMLQ